MVAQRARKLRSSKTDHERGGCCSPQLRPLCVLCPSLSRSLSLPPWLRRRAPDSRLACISNLSRVRLPPPRRDAAHARRRLPPPARARGGAEGEDGEEGDHEGEGAGAREGRGEAHDERAETGRTGRGLRGGALRRRAAPAGGAHAEAAGRARAGRGSRRGGPRARGGEGRARERAGAPFRHRRRRRGRAAARRRRCRAPRREGGGVGGGRARGVLRGPEGRRDRLPVLRGRRAPARRDRARRSGERLRDRGAAVRLGRVLGVAGRLGRRRRPPADGHLRVRVDRQGARRADILRVLQVRRTRFR